MVPVRLARVWKKPVAELWKEEEEASWLILLHYLWDFGKIAQHHRGSVEQSDQIFYQVLSFWSDLILSRQDVSDSKSTSASARGGKKTGEKLFRTKTLACLKSLKNPKKDAKCGRVSVDSKVLL